MKKQIEDQYNQQIIQDKKDLQNIENNLIAELEKLNDPKEDFNKKLASELERSLAVKNLNPIQQRKRDNPKRVGNPIKVTTTKLEIKSIKSNTTNSKVKWQK